MRKDGSDHKHTWMSFTQPIGDLQEIIHRCTTCGLRTRKRQTQHPKYQEVTDDAAHS